MNKENCALKLVDEIIPNVAAVYSCYSKLRIDGLHSLAMYLSNTTELPLLKKIQAWCLSDGTTTNPVSALCSCPLQQ